MKTAQLWKHLQSRKILTSTLFCVYGFLLLRPEAVVAQSKETASPGFHQITVASAKDWVACSQDGLKMGIVRTVPVENFPALGKSLTIYNLNSDLQPQEVLFQEEKSDRLITELQWARDVLFYVTIEGFNTPNQFWEWTTKSSEPSSLSTVLKHLGLRTWPQKVQEQQNFKTLRFSPPGRLSLFSSGNSNLLAFDPLGDVAKLADTNNKDDTRIFTERLLSLYQVPQGTLLRSLTLRLPFPGYRWWSGRGEFIPLFVSEDGKRLVSIVSSYYPWRSASRYQVPFVIAIDLESGNINAVTPDSGQNGLRLGGDPRYFKPGNPTAVDGGKQVVCNLDMSEAGNDMTFRFAYFTLGGEKIKEVTVFKQDLKRAGVPNGLLLTWTPDGTKVLIQSGSEVWLLDIEKWEGKRITSGIWIEDIVSWVKDRHLLVRVRKITDKKPDSRTQRQAPDVSDKIWGILSLS